MIFPLLKFYLEGNEKRKINSLNNHVYEMQRQARFKRVYLENILVIVMFARRGFLALKT